MWCFCGKNPRKCLIFCFYWRNIILPVEIIGVRNIGRERMVAYPHWTASLGRTSVLRGAALACEPMLRRLAVARSCSRLDGLWPEQTSKKADAKAGKDAVSPLLSAAKRCQESEPRTTLLEPGRTGL
jgi:hypothetical protein